MQYRDLVNKKTNAQKLTKRWSGYGKHYRPCEKVLWRTTQLSVNAPSEAWCILQGVSPFRVRGSHPPALEAEFYISEENHQLREQQASYMANSGPKKVVLSGENTHFWNVFNVN